MAYPLELYNLQANSNQQYPLSYKPCSICIAMAYPLELNNLQANSNQQYPLSYKPCSICIAMAYFKLQTL